MYAQLFHRSQGQTASVYSNNPYRAGLNSPDQKVIKITVKGYPISKSHANLKEYLASKGVKLTKGISFGKYRDPVTKELLE